MQADSAFVIGHSHAECAKPCQDYALHGTAGDVRWAVVSDGCSTGGHTDIGARLWAHAVRQFVEQSGRQPVCLADFGAEVSRHARALLAPFPANDGFATVVAAFSDGKQACTALLGDGCVAARLTGGLLRYWEVRYEANAPRYPAYALTPNGLAAWQSFVASTVVVVSEQTLNDKGELVDYAIQRHPAADYPGLWVEFASVAELEALAVCTDGVSSFEGLSIREALHELLAVKNPVGQFMQRRLGAMSRRWRKELAAPPVDDLAVACLWLAASNP